MSELSSWQNSNAWDSPSGPSLHRSCSGKHDCSACECV